MTVQQGSKGKMVLFDDFAGPEIPVAGNTAGVQNFPPFVHTGDGIVTNDSGIVQQSALGGVIRLTTTNENDHNSNVGTEVMLDVGLMGPIVIEARVQMDALTARRCYVGLTSANGATEGQFAEINAGTISYGQTAICGWLYDSVATADNWFYVYKGGTRAEVTAESSCNSGVAPVAGEWDVLRMEVMSDGLARFFINGALKAEVVGAASVTIDAAAVVSAGGVTTTIAKADVDYLYISANRDWTV